MRMENPKVGRKGNLNVATEVAENINLTNIKIAEASKENNSIPFCLCMPTLRSSK
jgi:hypothetical protein